MREWWMSWSTDQLLMAGGVLAGLLLLVFVLWLALGPGPKRRRRLRQVLKLVEGGDWHAALEKLQPIREGSHVSEAWQNRLADLEGKALLQGSATHLAEQDYETALNYGLHAARLLNRSPLEARATVQNAMLEEIRHRFSPAARTDSDTLRALIERTLRVQQPCREASFWQALCHLRDGQIELAETHLHRARSGTDRALEDDLPEGRGAPPAPPTPILEPALYLGALLLRQGKPKESLRYFTEANRLDSNCALVPLHLGCAMVAAGGDVGLAVRTLQKAIGPRGLGAWQDRPQAFWAEVFPENRSYIRKLAARYPFRCPLWGDGPNLLVRQGQLALAQGLQRLGQHEEAANLFDQVLKDGAPSLPVLRGLGMALVRLGRFEDASRPLRMAYDLENPKDRLTTGYLAWCAIKARNVAGDDRRKNLTWALRAITPFSAPADAEWAGLISTIFAEARASEMPLSLDDQLYLCEHLASVHAADPAAAAAFEQIHQEHPTVFRPEYAWLYAQALATHGGGGASALRLLEIALHDRDTVRTYFGERGWDFDAVERTYLERLAVDRPGHLPTVLGPEPLARMENLLLKASAQAEEAGQHDQALASVEAFVRLQPDHPQALDRLAALHHRAGRIDLARDVLLQWRERRPLDPLPLLRLALVDARPATLADALERLRQASSLATGTALARIAWLGARLALQEWARRSATGPDAAPAPGVNGNNGHVIEERTLLTWAEEFLARAIDADSAKGDALANLAALRWLRNDLPGLAALADRACVATGTDSRHRYFLTLPLLAAENWPALARACQVLTEVADPGDAHLPRLRLEAAYLEGLAHMEMGDLPRALERLQIAAADEDSLTAHLARARIGVLLFRQGHFDAAAAWWQRLPAERRSAWKLGEVLGGTQMLGALEAFRDGQYETAADRFRLAGRLGCRDRRMGSMLLLSLFKAGQQAAELAIRPAGEVT